MNTWKRLALMEVLVVIALVFIISNHHQEREGLLAERVYAGILKPESKLILNFKPLEEELTNYIATKSDATIGIYVTNLRDGASLGINENEGFEPASLNKLPMAIVIMQKVERGELTLEDKLPIRFQDIEVNSGTLYQRAGEMISVKQLLHAMLADSDNTAFTVLNHKITASEWNAVSDYLNYYEIREDTDSKVVYTTSPEANARIFTSLYLSTLLTPEHSEYILQELTNTSFKIQKIAGIPESVTIAQKFGTYYGGEERYFHSCGIIYLGKTRFFYCVMTKNLEEIDAEITTGIIVNKTYTYITETRKKLEENKAL